MIAFFPLRKNSEVDQPLVDGVHDLTAGSPGKTFRLLNAAALHAIDTGEERITLKTLGLDDVTRHVRTAAAMRRTARSAATARPAEFILAFEGVIMRALTGQQPGPEWLPRTPATFLASASALIDVVLWRPGCTTAFALQFDEI